jgi:hypothetical protein
MVMQSLNIDTIGPLIEDEEGFLYLIVVIDCFSRWVMCYPVRSVGAEDCAWALIQHFGIFGVAKEILSDNGTQFCNKIIDELIKIVGAEHITTTAYSKEENAIVERSNKEVVRHLRAILFDKNVITRWRRYVPFAQRICNAEVVSSTGVAPASIIFGEAINLDRDILSPNAMPEEHEHGDLSKYVADLILTQRAVIEIAKANQTAKDDAHMATSNEVEETVYEPNSYVLLDYPSGPPTKLGTQLRGPLQVISHQNGSYLLRDLVNGKAIPAHVSRIRPWVGTSNPTDAALRDTGAYLVESIVAHRGSIARNRSNLFFHVKWVGYDLSDTDWEPWKNFHTNAVVHQYLRDHNMAAIIPARFR